MKKILYEVRQDALKKLKTAKDEDSCQLIDAALYINALSKLLRAEGLVALEFFVEDLPELLQLPAKLIADVYSPKKVAEFATNDYWTRDPQGIQAMISYIYIRGTLFVQKGYNLNDLKEILGTLFPLNWRQEYYRKWEEAEMADILPRYADGTWNQ